MSTVLPARSRPPAGMLSPRSEPITVAEWLESPDSPEYSELYQGMLIVPPPPDADHQHVAMSVSSALYLVSRDDGGVTMQAPTAVALGPGDGFEPDVLYLSANRIHLLRRRLVDGPPDIVVEVSSPSTRTYDLRTKLPVYLAGGVREVWIADPVAAFGERIPSNIVEVGTAGLEGLPPPAPD